MSKLLDNLLEGTGIKPYILQQQHVNCYSGVWDTLYDRQYTHGWEHLEQRHIIKRALCEKPSQK